MKVISLNCPDTGQVTGLHFAVEDFSHLIRLVQESCREHTEALCLTHPLVAICTKEPCVMAFLHNNVSNPGLVILLQTDAGLPDGQQLVVENLHIQTHTAPNLLL